MEWIAYIVAAIFFVLSALCVVSVLIGLPGGWIMLAIALIIEFCDRWYLSPEHQPTFGTRLLIVCAALLLIGEIIETAAGAAGAKRGGASRRGMIGAIIGGMLGAILLTGLIPILFIGTIIGAIVGTFIGAIMGEVTGEKSKTVGRSIKPAIGATIGRVAGSFGKIMITRGVLALSRFGDVAIWQFGDLAMWRFGDLAIWRFGDLAI
jgi:uncharacterized protein